MHALACLVLLAGGLGDVPAMPGHVRFSCDGTMMIWDADPAIDQWIVHKDGGMHSATSAGNYTYDLSSESPGTFTVEAYSYADGESGFSAGLDWTGTAVPRTDGECGTSADADTALNFSNDFRFVVVVLLGLQLGVSVFRATWPSDID